MGLEAWAAAMDRHRRAAGLVALLVAFTGVSMLLNPTHATDLMVVGILVLVVGAVLLAILFWPAAAQGEVVEARSLGARLIHRLTWRGRLIRFFPAFGVATVVLDLAYNVFLSATPALQTEDLIVLLSAAALLGYGFVPPRYVRERDFTLLFFLFLDLLLVVPLLVARAVTNNVDASVDVYSWTALAPELGAILSVLGIANSVHAVAGATAPGLTFTPIHVGMPVTVVITTACSGIYSFGIFAAAFVSFVTTEYAHPSRKLWALLGFGFAASYLANLLRMTVIVLVGYYSDTLESNLQNLLLTHSYAGWIIFLGWIALFWGLLFRFLPIEEDARKSDRFPATIDQPRLQSGLCALCREALSPAIPATRCACGAYAHRSCLSLRGECPTCHRKAIDFQTGLPQGH